MKTIAECLKLHKGFTGKEKRELKATARAFVVVDGLEAHEAEKRAVFEKLHEIETERDGLVKYIEKETGEKPLDTGAEYEAKLKDYTEERKAVSDEGVPESEIKKADTFADRVEPPAEATAEGLQAKPETRPLTKKEKSLKKKRNHFTLTRLNSKTDEMEPVTFVRGEYVKAFISKDKWNEGRITGISHAKKEFKIGNLSYEFARAYKTEEPRKPVSKVKTAPLSEIIEDVNKKHAPPEDAVSRAKSILKDQKGAIDIDFTGLVGKGKAVTDKLGKGDITTGKPPVKPEGGEIWRITEKEWDEYVDGLPIEEYSKVARMRHGSEVFKAWLRGKEVPSNVLKEYNLPKPISEGLAPKTKIFGKEIKGTDFEKNIPKIVRDLEIIKEATRLNNDNLLWFAQNDLKKYFPNSSKKSLDEIGSGALFSSAYLRKYTGEKYFIAEFGSKIFNENPIYIDKIITEFKKDPYRIYTLDSFIPKTEWENFLKGEFDSALATIFEQQKEAVKKRYLKTPEARREQIKLIYSKKTLPKPSRPPGKGGQYLDESGSSQLATDLLNIGAHILRQGHTSFARFRRQLRRTLGDAWDKIKHLARQIYDSAKKVIANERGGIETEGPKWAKKAIEDYKKTIETDKNERVFKRSAKPPVIKEKFGPTVKTPKEIIVDTIEEVKTKDFWDKAATKTFDRLHPIKTFLSDKAYKLHRVETGTPAILAMFLRHGKLQWDSSGALRVDEKKRGFLPFLRSLGRDWDKFIYWTAAKRAAKLEEQGRERWLTKSDRDEIFKWTGGENNPKWVKAAKELGEFNANILDVAEQAGLIDPTGRKVWEQEFYVPFYRIFEDAATRSEFLKAPRKNKRFISAQIRRLKGAKRKLGDPLENLLHNWTHLIHESLRNVSRSEAFDYAQKEKLDIIKEVGAKDVNSYRSSKDKKVVYVTKNTKENVLMFQRGGKPVYLTVNEPELFEAMSNMNAQYFDNWAVRLMGKAKRALTYGATFGPGFRVANLLRDTMHTAMINKNFTPFIDSAKGFVKSWRENPEYIAFMSSGFGFGSSYVRADDPQAMGKYIKRIIKSEGQGAVKRILDTPKKMLDVWEKIGAASENAARVQLYSNLMKADLSHMESGFEGRDLLDFTMRGQANTVQFLIQTVPFLNARMQGLYKLGRAVADQENRKNFIVRGTLLTAASLALWWWNRDDERYKELEGWDRWSYYHFWIGDKHFRIPKPFEVGAIFSSLPETMMDVLYGNDETKHMAEFMAYTAKENFAIGVPQLFSPILEQWANKRSYTGRPIVGQHLKGLKPSEQKEPWTSETIQALAGKMGISPKRAEALIQGYFSTFGMFLLSGSDIVVRNAFDFPEKPTRKIDDYPLVGRFIKQAKPARYTKHQTWFYDIFNEIDQTVKTVNYYKRTGDYEKAKQLVSDKKEQLRYRKRFNKIRNRLRITNRQIKRIMLDNRLTSDVKAKRIDKLIQRKNDLLKKVYERYRKD